VAAQVDLETISLSDVAVVERGLDNVALATMPPCVLNMPRVCAKPVDTIAARGGLDHRVRRAPGSSKAEPGHSESSTK